MIDSIELENTNIQGAVKKAIKEIDSAVNGLVGKSTKPSQKLMVGLGDSMIENFSSFIYSFASASENQILIYRNQGVDGNTSAQVLARVDDVPKEADMVTLLCTTNDVSQNVTIEDHTANIVSIVASLRGRGFEVVALLAPPRNDTLPEAITTDLFNQVDYITYLKLGVPCFDPFRLLVDPLDGTWVAGASDDGTHPSANTEFLIGNNLWSAYDSRSFATLSPRINGQGINDNANMLKTYGGTIKPVNWNLAAAVVSSTVQASDGILGNEWETNITDAYNDMTSDRFPLEYNKVYMAVITYEHTVNSGAPKVSAYWESDQSKRRYIVNTTAGQTYDVSKTRFVTFIQLRDDVVESNMRFRVKVDAGTHEINIKLSEMQLFDITELGWNLPHPY
jgi:lysophospholipase L1-like esterase